MATTQLAASSVDVQSSPRGGVTVVTLRGEHDIATAPRIRAALVGALRRHVLVVDLRECDFIDGSVIGLLVGARSRARRSGGDLLVVNAGGRPLLTLRALSATHGLSVYDRAGGAVAPAVALSA